jgi:hypothetical protein
MGPRAKGRALRGVFEPRREKVTYGLRALCSDELHDSYSKYYYDDQTKQD